MNDNPRLPYGYEDNVTCTEDKNGRIVIHWPEGCRGTVISRELLDQMVEDKNNRPRWIPVEERLPEMGARVMVGHAVDGWVGIGERVLTGTYLHWEDDGEDLHEPTHWQPLPEPPEVQ